VKRFEWIIHVLIFALQTGGVVPGLLRVGSDTTPGGLGDANSLNTATTSCVLVIATFLLLRHARMAFQYVPWLLIALLILAFSSLLWSDYPDVTMRRSVSITTSVLWAWYVAARYDMRELISLTMQAIAVLAVASLAIAILAPGIGMDDPAGPPGWRGVFTAKNQTGEVMAVGTVAFCYGIISLHRKGRSLLPYILGLLLCGTLLYLSDSRTSWIIGFLGPFFCLSYRSMHRRAAVGIIIWATLILIFVPGVYILSDQLPLIFSSLGRDTTFTGRAGLWAILPSFIEDRLWLGHGFAAFWVEASPNVVMIWNATGWQPPSAHNGWLDILLELGLVGFALTALQILLVIINGIRAVVDGREPDAQFALLMVSVLLIVNMTESTLVRPANVIWITLVMSVVALAKIGKQRRSQTQPAGVNRRQKGLGFKLQQSTSMHR
jgi:exopolysaccharide production protein ExoQ